MSVLMCTRVCVCVCVSLNDTLLHPQILVDSNEERTQICSLQECQVSFFMLLLCSFFR